MLSNDPFQKESIKIFSIGFTSELFSGPVSDLMSLLKETFNYICSLPKCTIVLRIDVITKPISLAGMINLSRISMCKLAMIIDVIIAISPCLLSNTHLQYHELILSLFILQRDIFVSFGTAKDIPFTILTLEKEHTPLIKANNLSIFSINY